MIKKIYKDDYKRYRQCAKIAWLLRKEHHKQTLKLQDDLTFLFDLPKDDFDNDDKLDQIDQKQLSNLIEQYSFEDLQAINCQAIVDGLETGYHAKQYFQSTYECFDFEIYQNQNSQLLEKLNDKKISVFFEVRFEYKDCVMKADVLRRNGDGWDLIEVKATTKSKKEHFYDLLYQYYILINNDIKIKNIYLMHLNSFYIRDGDLDYTHLFNLSPTFFINSGKKEEYFFKAITKELENRDINEDLSKLKKIFNYSQSQIMDFLLLNNCANNSADYCAHVLEKIPTTDTIFNLYRLRKKIKIKWYYEGNLLLNNFDLNSYPLTFRQEQQVRVVKNLENIMPLKYKNQILKLFKDYKYPIYMYDFETFLSAIPQFNNTYSYQQIPFQYSIHVLLNDQFDLQKNNVIHYEFLATGEEDPRKKLVDQLVIDLQKHHFGVYVAYNKSFEIRCLKELGNLFSQYQGVLNKVIERTIDLMDWFTNFYIYKKEFNGSLSIKKTLPAFDPSFSYENLNIKKGDQASELFRKRVYNGLLKNQKNIFFQKLNHYWKTINYEQWNKNYRQDMLKYCCQDTWGMVVLFYEILQLIKKQQW